MKFTLIESFNRDMDNFSAVVNFDKVKYSICTDLKHPNFTDPDNRTKESIEKNYDYYLEGEIDCENFIDIVTESYYEFPILENKYHFNDLSDEETDKILNSDEIKEFIYDNAQDIINSNIKFFREYYYEAAQEEVSEKKQKEYNDDGYDW